MRPETILVETENGPVLINKTDFNPAIHKVAGPFEALVNAADNGSLVPATPAAVDANGNPVNAGDGGQFVPPTQTNTQQPGNDGAKSEGSQPVTPPVLLVTKNDKGKFIVVDMQQKPFAADGIDAKGYKTEKDAWEAVTAYNTSLTGGAQQTA